MSRVILIESGGVKIDPLGGDAISFGSPTVSHTFAGVDLGPASSSGLLIIGGGVVGGLSSIGSLTVNGNPATQVVTASGGGRSAHLFQITGESGAGDIVINSPNAATQFSYGAWKFRGVQNTTPTDFAALVGTLTQNPVAVNVDIAKLGACVAFVFADAVSSGTVWTGLSEDFEETSVNLGRASGASRKFTTAQTGLSISAATTLAGRAMLVAGSWR